MNSKKISFVVFVLALVGASIGYRILYGFEIQRTSMMFIGIPALLAITLVFTMPPKCSLQATGFRVTSIFLLLSGILLGEGLICILMAAPIFYFVTFMVICVYKASHEKNKNKVRCSLAIVAGIVSLEGINPQLSFDRESEVQYEAVIDLSREDVWSTLAKQVKFNEDELPLFFKFGFPLPVDSTGSGLEIGDRRIIEFEEILPTDNRLTLELYDISEQKISYRVLADNTKIASWLRWKYCTIELIPLDAECTKVIWSFAYERRLDPIWYFGPWQKFAVGEMAEYLHVSYFGRS